MNICRDNFDAEKFISEIKTRHSIWNFKSKEYNERSRRSKDWREVCKAMVPDFAERSKRECIEIENELQAKWKVLRDSFVRSLRNQKRVCAAGGTSRPYKYHDQMSFLMVMFKYQSKKRKYNYKILAPKNESQQEEKRTMRDDSLVNTITKNVMKRMSNQNESLPEELKLDVKEDDLVETITNNVMKRINNDINDEDRQFLLCLLGDVKRIPSEMKLDAKSDIINVIRHYTSKAGQYQSPTHMDFIDPSDPLVTMEMSEDSQDSEKEFKVNLTN